jgi:hypothetical protein
VSLDDDPTFTALSYCWGNANLRRYINVNGDQVSVTESLETALKYMRHGENNIPVWADAICINQSDRDEKSVQAAMMGDIYAHGKRRRFMLKGRIGVEPKDFHARSWEIVLSSQAPNTLHSQYFLTNSQLNDGVEDYLKLEFSPIPYSCPSILLRPPLPPQSPQLEHCQY